MSVYGEWKAATISAGGTSSSEVDLGRSYDFLEIQIPTLISCTIKLQVAEKTSGTFRDLGDGITTASGTHNYHDVLNLGGWQYIKVVASATQTATDRAIRVRGMRY
ncbi:hypothetical protein LCGC14_1949490 [marine sediment metagenome]|uniref:Uncharacterized protein n=1 Tax=marine sediment metagenome TaxID=412755 RepID=A0A0F9HW86_9ZZZZ